YLSNRANDLSFLLMPVCLSHKLADWCGGLNSYLVIVSGPGYLLPNTTHPKGNANDNTCRNPVQRG
ncbi:MAG: hypothetical protein AAFQ09_08190, partial [Pseudomonadota bacterium]